MTTDSGTAPLPGDQQQPDPATLAAAAQAPAQQETPEPQAEDIDAKDLAEAIAAAEAEKAAATTESEPEQPGKETQGQQDQQAQPPGGQQPPAAETPMIPKPRFDEVLNQRDKASHEAAYWRGVAEATKHAPAGTPAGQQTPQQQAPTAEQRLSAIHTEKDALAKKYDDGELTYSDLVKQDRDLANREQAIREEILLAKVAPQQKAPQKPEDDLFLDDLTAKIENENPWVKVLDKVGTNLDWDYFRRQAIENLGERGIDASEGKRGTFELRQEMAKLISQAGPALIGPKARAKGIAIPNEQTAPQQQGGKAPSSVAQARAAKLDLASRAPPNVAAMNGTTGGEANGIPSASRIESMSDDEIGKLPDSVRRQFLGLT